MLRIRSYMTLAGLSLIATAAASAQITSSMQTIALTAMKGQTVTLSAVSPTAQTVTLIDGQNNQFANPFATTVGWDVSNSTTTTVKLVAYFATPSDALVNGTDVIPSSLVEVSTDGGTNWHALNGSAVGGVGTAGGSYTLFTSAPTSGTNKKANSVVNFLVRVNLTGNPGTSAGTYTGTLNLMAICS